MNRELQASFKTALINAMVVLGLPILAKPDFYRWADYENAEPRRQDIKRLGIDYDATPLPTEEMVHHFIGTFADSNYEAVLQVKLRLGDGTDLPWRYRGNWSELIEAVCGNE